MHKKIFFFIVALNFSETNFLVFDLSFVTFLKCFLWHLFKNISRCKWSAWSVFVELRLFLLFFFGWKAMRIWSQRASFEVCRSENFFLLKMLRIFVFRRWSSRFDLYDGLWKEKSSKKLICFQKSFRIKMIFLKTNQFSKTIFGPIFLGSTRCSQNFLNGSSNRNTSRCWI